MKEIGDFPGGIKPIISAWLSGKRFEEGLKIGERVVVKEWPIKGRELEGEVIESWKKREYQFFISEHSWIALMGVSLCYCSDNELFLIADKVEREINCRFLKDLPGPGLLVKRVILRGEEYLSFVFNLSLVKNNNFCTREKNPKSEGKLDEAIEEFEKECLVSFQR